MIIVTDNNRVIDVIANEDKVKYQETNNYTYIHSDFEEHYFSKRIIEYGFFARLRY